MSRKLTADQFSSAIAHNLTWRIRELSDIKSAIIRADDIARRSLLRALVPLAYAHWEGGIKFIAKLYLEYVTTRKIPYLQLDRQFAKNAFISQLGGFFVSRPTFAQRCQLVSDVLSIGDERLTSFDDELVSTRSNLNFDVFGDICLVCGVNIRNFSHHERFIDLILVKRRNEIAHGENTFIDFRDLDGLIETVVSMVREFGNELDNKVQLSGYMV